MRDYQIRGLNWMIFLYENGINGILVDEMVSWQINCVSLKQLLFYYFFGYGIWCFSILKIYLNIYFSFIYGYVRYNNVRWLLDKKGVFFFKLYCFMLYIQKFFNKCLFVLGIG